MDRLKLTTEVERWLPYQILVVGDVMLDEHIYCRVSGFSPESETAMKLVAERQVYRPGGAANVALNLKRLGAYPVLFGTIGSDDHGRELRNLLAKEEIEAHLHFADRPTTLKRRYLTLKGHQILRVDVEQPSALDREVEKRVIEDIRRVTDCGAVVVSDYNKGVVSRSLLDWLRAHIPSKPFIVDPKRPLTFYGSVTVATPNLKEARAGVTVLEDASVEALAMRLPHYAEHLVITLAELGCHHADSITDRHEFIPTRPRQVGDPAGCGDSFVAALAMAMANSSNVSDACRIANCAGGVTFDHVGVHAVSRAELRREVYNLETNQP